MWEAHVASKSSSSGVILGSGHSTSTFAEDLTQIRTSDYTRTQLQSTKHNSEGSMDPSQEPYEGLRAILAHPELMVSTSFANPSWTKRCP